ncbi:MAG: hypothetical protein HC817_14250 [Saprospiraceae bacterium]|nr:hypothetical protein [Saprospiraceae bacterium]
MKKSIFYIAFLLFSVSAHAQMNANADSAALSKKYLQNTMYLKQSFFTPQYEINGTSTSTGFFNSNLRNEFLAKNVSPMTLKELDKSTKNSAIATAVSFASFIPLFLIKNSNSDAQNTILASITIGTALISLPLSVRSQNQRNRAVWLYNRDMMSR